MAAGEFHEPEIDSLGRRMIATNLSLVGVVFLLMVVAGLLMRLAQAGWMEIGADRFYQLLTVHGTGMVGIAILGGSSVMWYFLSRYVRLTSALLVVNLLLFLAGVVMILGAAFVGGYASAWTFLYPLPAVSGGVWGQQAAFWYLFGLLLIGVGFLLLFLDVGRAIVGRYGGIFRALGWPQLFGSSTEELPPPTVVASTMSTVVTVLCLIAGATILILSIVNLFVPGFTVDPLFAKNIIYFFGHTVINATIYMAVTVVYELLPVHTGRPYKSSKVFLAAWAGSTIMVLVIFPHHLLMDFAMPKWAMIFAQILSYTNSFPVLTVTGLGALALVHRSGMKWNMISGLIFLSMFGWMAGVVPAVIDATIVVNSVMHNTLWVPGHFHFYLLLGLLPMILAFMYHLARLPASLAPSSPEGWALWLYVLAGFGFVLMFLNGGSHSVPRRWAVHLPEWMVYDQIASVFAIVVLAAATFFILRTIAGLARYATGK